MGMTVRDAQESARYLKIVKTVDIDRRLRELESKSAVQK
jgi:hypothetical protein